MIVFEILVYSCITINAPVSGELMQKTCNWSARSGLYTTQEACLAAAPTIGSDVFSDVADGRKVEKINCVPLQVMTGDRP